MTVHLGRPSHTGSENVREEQNAFLGKSLNFRYLNSMGGISGQSHVIRKEWRDYKYTRTLNTLCWGIYALLSLSAVI